MTELNIIFPVNDPIRKRLKSKIKAAAKSSDSRVLAFVRTAGAIAEYVAAIRDDVEYKARVELEAMLQSKAGAIVEPACERCGAPMKITKSYGESYFAGCTNDKGCRNLRQLTAEDVVSAPTVFERQGDIIDFDAELNRLINEGLSWRLLSYTEASTRDEFIDPLLRALGWDIYSGGNAARELRLDYNLVADYVLFNSHGEIFAIVEAKNLYEDLVKHESQLQSYMEAASAEVGILTNGFAWRVYRNTETSGFITVCNIEDILCGLNEELAAELYMLVGPGGYGL